MSISENNAHHNAANCGDTHAKGESHIKAPYIASMALPKWIIQAIALLCLSGLGVYYLMGAIQALSNLMLLICTSLFLSFAIEPAVNFLERKGIKRYYGTTAVFLGIAAVVIGMMIPIGFALVTQTNDLIETAKNYNTQNITENIEKWAKNTLDTEINIDIDGFIDNFVNDGSAKRLLESLAPNVLSASASLAKLLLDLLTIALFTFFLVAKGPTFRKTMLSMLDTRRRPIALHIWNTAVEKTGAYIYSRTLLATLSAILHFAAFTWIGVPSPLALALWLGTVSQFIPAIGTYIAGALPIGIALLDDPRKGLIALAVVVAYQQIENYFISPRITAKTMDLNVAVAFGSVIAGIALLGMLGALLALPFAATVQALLSTWLQARQQNQADQTQQDTYDRKTPTTEQGADATVTAEQGADATVQDAAVQQDSSDSLDTKASTY